MSLRNRGKENAAEPAPAVRLFAGNDTSALYRLQCHHCTRAHLSWCLCTLLHSSFSSRGDENLPLFFYKKKSTKKDATPQILLPTVVLEIRYIYRCRLMRHRKFGKALIAIWLENGAYKKSEDILYLLTLACFPANSTGCKRRSCSDWRTGEESTSRGVGTQPLITLSTKLYVSNELLYKQYIVNSAPLPFTI